MALNFTSNILSLYAGNVGNDANYQSPGNFGVPPEYVQGDGVTVKVTSAGTGYTAIPNVNFNNAGTGGSGAAGSARMKVLTAVVGSARGSGYQINETLSHSDGTATTPANYRVERIAPAASQGHANYNNTGSNGTFAGGTGYAPSDTITLNDGTVITVTAVSSGVVTQFTMNVAASTGSATNRPTLTQTSSSGAGIGFTLTLHTANQGVHTVAISHPGVFSALPTTTNGGTTVAPAGGTGANLNTTWGVAQVVMTNNGTDYTSAPVATASAGNAVFEALLSPNAGTGPSVNERSLLTMVEVLRSYIATLENPGEARFANTLFRKMLAELNQGGGASSYDAAATATRALNEGMRFYAKRPRNSKFL